MALLVHVGQCGNQLGGEFWDIATCAAAGLNSSARESYASSLFRNGALQSSAAQQHRYHPRAVLVDSEPKVIERLLRVARTPIRLRRGAYPVMFDPKRAVVDAWQCGRANSFPMGFGFGSGFCPDRAQGNAPGSSSSQLLEAALEAVRAEAEASDRFAACAGGGLGSGLVVTHSLGGGTGAGLGCRLLLELRDTYPAPYILSAAVLPFSAGGSAMQSYNVCMSLRILDEVCDGVMLLSNEDAQTAANAAASAAGGKPLVRRCETSYVTRNSELGSGRRNAVKGTKFRARTRADTGASASSKVARGSADTDPVCAAPASTESDFLGAAGDEMRSLNRGFARELAGVLLPISTPTLAPGTCGGNLSLRDQCSRQEHREDQGLDLLPPEKWRSQTPVRGQMRPRHGIQLRKSSRQPSISSPPMSTDSGSCAAGCGEPGVEFGLSFGVDSVAADLGELVTNVCPGPLRFFGVQTWFETETQSARSSTTSSAMGRWTELARRPAARGCTLDGITFGAMCFARGGGSRSVEQVRKTATRHGPVGGNEKQGQAMRGKNRLARGRTGLPDDEIEDLSVAASTLRAALRFAPWNSAPLSVQRSVCSLPPILQPGVNGNIIDYESPSRSLTVAACRSNTVVEFEEHCRRARRKLQVGAYVHWLERHGAERADVSEAIECVQDIIHRYQDFARCT